MVAYILFVLLAFYQAGHGRQLLLNEVGGRGFLSIGIFVSVDHMIDLLSFLDLLVDQLNETSPKWWLS